MSDQTGGVGANPDEERLDVKLDQSTRVVKIDSQYKIRLSKIPPESLESKFRIKHF